MRDIKANDLQVRELGIGDLDKFMNVTEEYFYEGKLRYLTFDKLLFKQFIENAIHEETAKIFVVYYGEEIAGYSAISHGREYTVENIGEMYQFYVRKKYRGTLVARLLALASDTKFDEWNCAIRYVCGDPMLDKTIKNDSMFANVWKKFGYKISGVCLRKDYLDGR